jgi:hypothetical protein
MEDIGSDMPGSGRHKKDAEVVDPSASAKYILATRTGRGLLRAPALDEKAIDRWRKHHEWP